MSLKSSMYVFSIETNNGFFLYNLYELLPIVPIYNYRFKKDNTLPFFGVDDCIVSLIPNGDIIKTKRPRGVRISVLNENQSGSFGNSLAVDFQTHKKNVHIKISSSKESCSKFHITGASTPDMAKDISQKLVEYINTTDMMWKPFFLLNMENRLYIVNMVINEIIENGDSPLKYGDPIMIKRIELLRERIGDLISSIDIMLRFTLEINYSYQEYKKRLYDICLICPGQYSIFHGQQIIELKSLDIYNGVYSGMIGYKDLILYHICTSLKSRGYNSEFHNIKKPVLKIVIPILDSSGVIIERSNGKILAHKFSILDKGTFKLYSQAMPEEVMSIGYNIINVIKEIVNSPEYLQLINPNYSDIKWSTQLANIPIIRDMTSTSSLNINQSNKDFSFDLLDENSYSNDF